MKQGCLTAIFLRAASEADVHNRREQECKEGRRHGGRADGRDLIDTDAGLAEKERHRGHAESHNEAERKGTHPDDEVGRNGAALGAVFHTFVPVLHRTRNPRMYLL